jgi:hypothetical protein
LPISCGDSSEHEGPDSSKPIPFYFINHFRLIDDSVSFLLPSFFACPNSTEGGRESIAGTAGTTTAIDGAVADEPERFESERNV